MYKQLYQLAEKIDNINYEYDTYGYMDNLDTTDTIGEGRQKEIKEIWIDLLEGNISDYIEFLNDIIEDIEGDLLNQATEVLKELKEIKS